MESACSQGEERRGEVVSYLIMTPVKITVIAGTTFPYLSLLTSLTSQNFRTRTVDATFVLSHTQPGSLATATYVG